MYVLLQHSGYLPGCLHILSLYFLHNQHQSIPFHCQAFRSISASAPLDTSGVTLDDCATLAHAWLKLMPIETHTKQGLLEIETPLLRLELVGDWLVRLGWLPAEGPAAARAP